MDKKRRPPVWQQGASRSFIENPDEGPGPAGAASPRTVALVRCLQAALIAGALTALTVAGIRHAGYPSLISVFLWPAVFLGRFLRNRAPRQPALMPPRSRRVQAVAALGLFLAWAAWIVLMESRAVPEWSSAGAWILSGIAGFVLLVALAAASHRARDFRWREAAEPVRG